MNRLKVVIVVLCIMVVALASTTGVMYSRWRTADNAFWSLNESLEKQQDAFWSLNESFWKMARMAAAPW